MFQHLNVEVEGKEAEINNMRDGYFIVTLTSADIQEIIEIRGKVIKIYEGVFCEENFKMSPFRTGIDLLFNSR